LAGEFLHEPALRELIPEIRQDGLAALKPGQPNLKLY